MPTSKEVCTSGDTLPSALSWPLVDSRYTKCFVAHRDHAFNHVHLKLISVLFKCKFQNRFISFFRFLQCFKTAPSIDVYFNWGEEWIF